MTTRFDKEISELYIHDRGMLCFIEAAGDSEGIEKTMSFPVFLILEAWNKGCSFTEELSASKREEDLTSYTMERLLCVALNYLFPESFSDRPRPRALLKFFEEYHDTRPALFQIEWKLNNKHGLAFVSASNEARATDEFMDRVPTGTEMLSIDEIFDVEDKPLFLSGDIEDVAVEYLDDKSDEQAFSD